MTYEQMNKKLDRMSNEELKTTWQAMKRAVTFDIQPEWYGDWVEFVYSEMSNRGLI